MQKRCAYILAEIGTHRRLGWVHRKHVYTYVCAHVYTHVYIRIYTHIYAHIYTRVYTHVQHKSIHRSIHMPIHILAECADVGVLVEWVHPILNHHDGRSCRDSV